MPITYKELVRSHIQNVLEKGVTQRDLAVKLGLNEQSRNFISMVLSDAYPEQLLPIGRLPALSRVCGLTCHESLQLVKALVNSRAKKGVQLDSAVLEWMLSCNESATKVPHAS
ncbi:hypothetical protein LC612_33030 [Nostoc sp. CHAB 5834]|nr:hypothetical protein [Nostoc sp. CHAB 5834]